MITRDVPLELRPGHRFMGRDEWVWRSYCRLWDHTIGGLMGRLGQGEDPTEVTRVVFTTHRARRQSRANLERGAGPILKALHRRGWLGSQTDCIYRHADRQDGPLTTIEILWRRT